MSFRMIPIYNQRNDEKHFDEHPEQQPDILEGFTKLCCLASDSINSGSAHVYDRTAFVFRYWDYSIVEDSLFHSDCGGSMCGNRRWKRVPSSSKWRCYYIIEDSIRFGLMMVDDVDKRAIETRLCFYSKQTDARYLSMAKKISDIYCRDITA